METKILAFIKKHPNASLRQIGASVGCSHSAVNYHIQQLLIEGKLKRIEQVTKWEIV
jgi:predicted transcriptional regulator